MPETIRRLSEGVQQNLPIALTEFGTFTTAERVMRVRGPITKTRAARSRPRIGHSPNRSIRRPCWRRLMFRPTSVRR